MNRDAEYQKLKVAGEAHRDRMDMLTKTADWIREQVNILCQPSIDEIDEWSEDEQRAFHARSQEMLGRMKVTWEELVKADNQYHEIREKVNAFFGKEVLKDRPRVSRGEFLG